MGHGGTYDQVNGGEFGRVAVLYLRWRLKGDNTVGATFVATVTVTAGSISLHGWRVALGLPGAATVTCTGS